MKKRELNKQRHKLKNEKNIKWINRAKNMCVIIVLLFLVYVLGFSLLVEKEFSQVIVDYPVISVGFVIATANLFVWYVLKRLIMMLKELQHIEFAQLTLLIIVVSQLLLLNFISVALLVYALYSYFDWSKFSFKTSISCLKEEKLVVSFIGIMLLLSIFIFLAFTISFATI